MRADDNGNPASARRVRSYLMRAFGDRLGEVREAMEDRTCGPSKPETTCTPERTAW